MEKEIYKKVVRPRLQQYPGRKIWALFDNWNSLEAEVESGTPGVMNE